MVEELEDVGEEDDPPDEEVESDSDVVADTEETLFEAALVSVFGGSAG